MCSLIAYPKIWTKAQQKIHSTMEEKIWASIR